MPGAHVERLNPTLWNSPDLFGAWGYHRPTYFHGPTQYLTLYPLSFLDSFAQIAAVLLPLYAVVLALTFWVMWLIAKRLGADRAAFVPLFASTFLFFPLLQAYLQREFEVVLTLMLAAALWLLLNDRKSWAAALFAYAAWFSTSRCCLAGISPGGGGGAPPSCSWQPRWRSSSRPSCCSGSRGSSTTTFPAMPGRCSCCGDTGSISTRTGHLHGTGFCGGWLEHDTTFANLRHGLCSMAVTRPWVNPPAIYLTICAAVAAAYLTIERRLARPSFPPPQNSGAAPSRFRSSRPSAPAFSSRTTTT